ncbi:MAG TPA: DUF3226 domain-containing protein [Thermoguttaceae bacterium]|nr:DUF3226 domain-containing protein [Thermoguttaceae bacterium]
MGKRILLVEGQDDQHVMWNLFEVRAVPKMFTVERPNPHENVEEGVGSGTDGGDTALLDSIRRWLLEVDLDCLAIVIDANDKGPAARWQSIRSRLLNAGYQSIPEKHSLKGTVFELPLAPRSPRSVRFSVWVMPDNQSTGMLEDFLAGLIREDDEMLPRVDGFLDSIPTEQRRFRPQHRPKARIHTWLAVGERPGRPMGQAIKADSQLDANHPTVQPFLDWVQVALVD